MTYRSDRSQKAAQQFPERQTYAYEPQPLSLHDEETLPDRYPAFYSDPTSASPVGALPSMKSGTTPDPVSPSGINYNRQAASRGYPASVYPPAYRSRPFLPWLLIAAGALGGLLLLLGLGFTAFNAAGSRGTPAPSVSSLPSSSSQNGSNSGTPSMAPSDVISNYYNALEQQNYSQAYTYLSVASMTSPRNDGQPASQDLFARQAGDADDYHGAITNYSIYQVDKVDNNYARAMVGIRRADNYYYHVSMDLRLIDGAWRIVQFNRI